MSAPLLDADFLRRLEALRRRLLPNVSSGAAGERAGPRRGSGAEFREHRAYAAGDDPRRIDWMAYARSGEPLVKLFRAEEDRVLRLLVDSSASLDFGQPSKFEFAQRLAAALGYMALAGSERAELIDAAGAAQARPRRAPAAHRGRRAFPALCRDIQGLQAAGVTRLARSLELVLARASRPGLLVILSDFLDPEPYQSMLSRARAAGHELVLIQILAREELEPELEGDLALEDSESGALVELTADPRALAAYAAQLSALIERLRELARSLAATYVLSPSDAELEPVVRRVLSRQID